MAAGLTRSQFNSRRRRVLCNIARDYVGAKFVPGRGGANSRSPHAVIPGGHCDLLLCIDRDSMSNGETVAAYRVSRRLKGHLTQTHLGTFYVDAWRAALRDNGAQRKEA